MSAVGLGGLSTKVQNHPAETAGPLATALALLIAKAFGVSDVDTLAAIAIVLAFVPAAVTWIVLLIRGRNG